MCEIKKPKVKIIGIGGAGCTIVNELLKHTINGAEYFVADLDEGMLRQSKCENKITLIPQHAFPLDMMRDVCNKAVNDTDMLIIISGLGGYVGSTFAPHLAEVAKEIGITAVAVVCTPFEFEGKSRMAKSVESLEKLKHLVDTVIVMPNHRIKRIVPKSASMRTAMTVANTVITETVNCIVAPIYEPGVLNVEFEDVVYTLQNGGLAYCGIGIGEGENCTADAIEGAIHNPISSTKINSAKRILLTITGGENMELQDITTVADTVRKLVDVDAKIILSAKIEERWNNRMRVAIVGMADEKEKDVPQTKAQSDNSTTQFNDEMESVLSKANALAEQYKSSYIASEHLVFAMLLVNCKVGEILKSCGCDKVVFEKFFVKTLSFDAVIKGYTPRTKMILQHAKENAVLKKGYGTAVGTEYVLYSALSADSLASKILKAMGVNLKKLIYLLEEAMDS